MDAAQKAARGRARGRSRAVPQTTPPEAAEPAAVQVFGVAQVPAAGRRLSGGSGSGESTNGNNRRGSGNGNGDGSNGNGNGGGSNGNSSNGSPRGGSPRGMTPRPVAAQERERYMDYVQSRPAPDFVKMGTSHDSSRAPPRIVANYYEFITHPSFKMKMYSVQIKPQVDETRIIRRLLYPQKDAFGCSYMLTGLMLFVTRPLPPDSLVFHATHEDTNYEVTLNFVKDVESSENTVFQFFNIVVRQMQQLMKFKLLGRHYFNPAANSKFPAWNLELWPGFQNSIRQQEAGLMMNVEGVWKVLQTTDILSIIDSIRTQHPQNYQSVCEQKIVGMTVITRYGGNLRGTRAYKISRIDFNANCNSKFETRSEAGPIQKSYVDYYKEKYDIVIRMPDQPMLVSEPKLRDVRRGQTGDIYLVPELCYPCGLNEDLRSNFRLMKDLAVCLHQPPTERVHQMETFVGTLRANTEIKTTLTSWGIKLKPNPVEFEARTLKPEEIFMGGNKRVTPDDKADWTMSFRRNQMLSTAKLTTWAVIVTGRDRPGVANLVGTMKRVGGPLGYQIAEPQVFPAGDVRQFPETIGGAMAKSHGKLDLCFIVLPNNNADNYAAVKRRCSVEYGIPSQCFLSKNLQAKGLMSICTKMVIQMNAKQGGEPWGIKNPLKNILVIGYDVHHAGPAGGSSISAMCASTNESLGKYYSYIRKTPTARIEVAEQFALMFENCLMAWKEKNGCLPQRIMIYRDGVGEGQLWDVFNVEINAVKTRIGNAYGAQPLPKLSYIVVNKRITTRFFQKSNQGFTNPLPGLIVDSVVTRPERYDFFLISQTARQGCVGPTYYNVLYDESELSPDKLQVFTYRMCHLYYNWSGTVAVPGPCQYAHKLALQTGTALKRPADPKLSFLLHFL